MRYYEIINEGFKEVEQKYLDQNWNLDPEEIKNAIETFKSLRDRNQLHGNERDIDWWGKNKTVSEFLEFVKNRSQERSKTQVKRSKIVGKSITVQEDDEWLIVVPLDKDASCFHGKNSDWCTAKPTHTYFENYVYERGVILIYCLQKNTGAMWAIAYHTENDSGEFFDKEDAPMNQIEFNRQTGLDSGDLVVMIKNNQTVRNEIFEMQRIWKNLNTEVYNTIMLSAYCTPSQELEQKIIRLGSTRYASAYVRGVGVFVEEYNQHNSHPYQPQHMFMNQIIDMSLQGDHGKDVLVTLLKFGTKLNEKQQELAVSNHSLSITIMIQHGIIPTEKMLRTAIDNYSFKRSLLPMIEHNIPIPEGAILYSFYHYPTETYEALKDQKATLSKRITDSGYWRGAEEAAKHKAI